MFGVPLVMLPLVGGGFVTLGLQYAKIPNVTFWKCFKAYLLSCTYGFVALVPLAFIMHQTHVASSSRHLIQFGVFLAAQLVFIPLFLRHISWRALGVLGAAVLLANLATYALVIGIQAQ
jgi:hypothetical protein